MRAARRLTQEVLAYVAIRYAKDRVDDAIKVVVKAKGVAAHRVAAE
jgi:hypothetical protein